MFSRPCTQLATRRRFVAPIVACLVLSACGGSADADGAVALPKVVACDEAAAGMQVRVEEAREILGERVPSIGDGLQRIIELIRKEQRQRAESVYERVGEGLEQVEDSSNEVLDRFDATVADCDKSASKECWSQVTAAYSAAANTAITTLQGPLRSAFERVEVFFKLDKKATKKVTKSAYLELRTALQKLRAGVVSFADTHNSAVDEFNACTTA